MEDHLLIPNKANETPLPRADIASGTVTRLLCNNDTHIYIICNIDGYQGGCCDERMWVSVKSERASGVGLYCHCNWLFAFSSGSIG